MKKLHERLITGAGIGVLVAIFYGIFCLGYGNALASKLKFLNY
jgi:hypothetical protein